jgi:hypothetical protein
MSCCWGWKKCNNKNAWVWRPRRVLALSPRAPPASMFDVPVASITSVLRGSWIVRVQRTVTGDGGASRRIAKLSGLLS